MLGPAGEGEACFLGLTLLCSGHGRPGALPDHHHSLLPRCHGLPAHVRRGQPGLLHGRAGLVSGAGHCPPNLFLSYPHSGPLASWPPIFLGPPRSRHTRGTTLRCSWWGTSVTWRTSERCPQRMASASPMTWVSASALGPRTPRVCPRADVTHLPCCISGISPAPALLGTQQNCF